MAEKELRGAFFLPHDGSRHGCRARRFSVQQPPVVSGLFLAPHVVAQAVKSAIFAAALFDMMGFKTLPAPQTPRNDIIQAIELGTKEKLVAFCQGIQKYSPGRFLCCA